MAKNSTVVRGRELYEREYELALQAQKRRMRLNPRQQSLIAFITHESGRAGKPWTKMSLKARTAVLRMYSERDNWNKTYRYTAGPNKGLTSFEGALKEWLLLTGRIDQMNNQEFVSYVAGSRQRRAA